MQVLDLRQNYFDLFSIDVNFDVDVASLQKKQQALQAQFHPDRFVNADDHDKRLSVQQASWINEGFQTLSNPVKRARYMLEINNLELNDETETTSDTAFLMEQIELREKIDACRNHSDPLAQCEKIESDLELRLKQLCDEFVKNYQAGTLELARQVSRKMQFVRRIQEQLMELQFELEDELG